MEIKAKDFSGREELEKHIVATYGRTTDKKDHTIVGTEKELADHKIKHGQSLWGIMVTATDYQQKEKVVREPRGERKVESFVNGKNISIKKRK